MKGAMMPDFITGLGDSGRRTADLAVEAVGNNPAYFRRLVDISFTEPYPACMRAARVAQLSCEQHPALILPHVEEVITRIEGHKVSGVKRSYLKVISDNFDMAKPEDPGKLVQMCFDWLISPKEDPSIRIYAAEIIYQVTLREPDLKNELVTVLEEVVTEDITSIRNRGKKILARLSA
jgi:hypothetical protein